MDQRFGYESMNLALDRDLNDRLPDQSLMTLNHNAKPLPDKLVLGTGQLADITLETMPTTKGAMYRVNRLCTQYPPYPPDLSQPNEKPLLLLHLSKITTVGGQNKHATSKDLIYHLPEKKKPTNLNFRRPA